ncbi:hypothetical protein LIA77_11475 [Sarocladium implicatum]|nr:hypothetical protein LIA77_11475 [Sarocladium implicatum]
MASSVALRNAVTAWLTIRVADKLAPCSSISVLVYPFPQTPSAVTCHLPTHDHWVLTLHHEPTDTFHSFEAYPEESHQHFVVGEFQGDPENKYGRCITGPLRIGEMDMQWWFSMQALVKELSDPIYDNASQNYVLILWGKMMEEGMITRAMKEDGEQVLLKRFGPKLSLMKSPVLLKSLRNRKIFADRYEGGPQDSSIEIDIESELASM